METCPSCGAALKPGAKFCTHCGFKIEQSAAPQQEVKPVAPIEQQQSTASVPPVPPVAPQQPAPQTASNPSVDHAKNVLKAYWQWLLTSLKHPSVNAGLENKWTGYVSFGLIGLFSALTILVPALRGTQNMAGRWGSAISQYSSELGNEVNGRVSGAATSIFFGALIAIVVYVFAVLVLVSCTAFVVRKLSKSGAITFTDTVNEYARGISLAVLLTGIVMVMNVIFPSITLYMISMVVLGFCVALMFINYFRVSLSGVAKSNFDVTYIMMIATFVLYLLLVLVSVILILSVAGSALSNIL